MAAATFNVKRRSEAHSYEEHACDGDRMWIVFLQKGARSRFQIYMWLRTWLNQGVVCGVRAVICSFWRRFMRRIVRGRMLDHSLLNMAIFLWDGTRIWKTGRVWIIGQEGEMIRLGICSAFELVQSYSWSSNVGPHASLLFITWRVLISKCKLCHSKGWSGCIRW